MSFPTGFLAIIQESFAFWALTVSDPDYTYSIDTENVITLLKLGSPVSTSDPEYLSLISFIEDGNDYVPDLGYPDSVTAIINGVPTEIVVNRIIL